MADINPYKVYTPNDIVKDSGYWDYLQYIQLNRIGFLTTTIWDERKTAGNKLLNLISAIDTLEFYCMDRLKTEKNSKEYASTKPMLFKKLQAGDVEALRNYIEGDAYKQLQLKIMINNWLKALNAGLGSMKSVKRVNLLVGEGPTNMDFDADMGE